MSQPSKPTSSTSTTQQKPEAVDQALPDPELETVSGGNVKLNEIKFVKKYDKSSSGLG